MGTSYLSFHLSVGTGLPLPFVGCAAVNVGREVSEHWPPLQGSRPGVGVRGRQLLLPHGGLWLGSHGSPLVPWRKRCILLPDPNVLQPDSGPRMTQ